MEMKIIFLDIDGVLNNEINYNDAALEQRYVDTGEYDDIDKRCVSLLNTLIKSTGAKVVVSSTWRIGRTTEQLQETLNKFGFEGEVIGITPWMDRTQYMLRGNEIYAWLDQNEDLLGMNRYDFNRYVIFDDDSDMLLWQKDNFIQIDPYVGLTPRNIWRAEHILNKI